MAEKQVLIKITTKSLFHHPGDLWTQTDLPCAIWVVLSKLLNLLKYQFSDVQNGDKNTYILGSTGMLNEIIRTIFANICKILNTGLGKFLNTLPKSTHLLFTKIPRGRYNCYRLHPALGGTKTQRGRALLEVAELGSEPQESGSHACADPEMCLQIALEGGLAAQLHGMREQVPPAFSLAYCSL